MSNLFQWIGGALKALGSLVVPVLGKARSSTGTKAFRWLVHFVLVLAVLVLAFVANERLGVRGWGIRFLGRFWIPILALVLYAIFWVGYWLWRLLKSEDLPEFPDIVAAWSQSLASLDRAAISLYDTPLFLILGQPEKSADNLFAASGISYTVKPNANMANAPLQVYANRDVIFVLCPGASLLGRWNQMLKSDLGSDVVVDRSVAANDVKTNDPNAITPELDAIRAILTAARKEGRNLDQLTPAEEHLLRSLERLGKTHRSPFKDRDQVELCSARLRFLTRLIAQDRHPRPGFNGVLVLIPYFGLETDQYATDTGDVCRRDLFDFREGSKLRAPVIAAVADLEMTPGFRTFVAQCSDRERRNRTGQRFPLVPNLGQRGQNANDELPPILESLGSWVCTSTVSAWVFKKFQLENGSTVTQASATSVNSDLFLFCEQMRQRRNRLGQILSVAFHSTTSEPHLFGGCYLVGTGADAASDQAFVYGVFQRLLDEQNYVSWTHEAFEEDARAQRKATLGYFVLGIMLTICLAVLGWYVYGAISKR